ncbi:MAG: ATP-binding protein [Saccharospirillaceae bacterium]|nr:AAA family ATPase [Pseudomonadales bacterium]NRB77457.1 ATP-binding protein [Saccharospirillaceae bacterium]
MKRSILHKLLAWKNKPKRKPLLIDGARQTGKTFLLHTLLGNTFKSVIRIDFLESPEFKDAFTDSLNPQHIINSIELITGQAFNCDCDLLILDEIGECPKAVTALKYFAEQTPTWFIAASGSNIGLLNSFPVGKVEQHNLYPLSFYEFLLASNEPALITSFENKINSTVVHKKLFEQLTDYYFTGGMPEAVNAWFEMKSHNIIDRIQTINDIQKDLISGYIRDFGKYSGKVDAGLIEAVFKNIPAQLSQVLDESVKRFMFKGVIAKKSRYNDFASAITWLDKCRLVLPNYIIEGTPHSPLAANKKDNKVKLFLFDVGLLNNMLSVSYKEIKQQNYAYKGYVAENFVQQEFASQGYQPTYSWQDARAEIEFIKADDVGNIFPIEVKSGKRTRAKSLQSYINKNSPLKTIKLTGTQGSDNTELNNIVLPLYFAQNVFEK